MADKWAHADVLDKGPNEIRARANRMVLLKAYTDGDNYATVAGNIIAEQAMTTADNSYYEFSSSGANRVLTIKTTGRTSTATATSGAAPDLHIGFLEGTSNVLFVTDETTNVVVNNGDTINWPTSNITYQSNQPT